MSKQAIPFAKLRVMIAMQNGQMAEFFQKYFRDQRVELAKIVENIPDATEKMGEHEYNLFLVDDGFSDNSGLDFVRFLRMVDSPMAEAPVMVILPTPNKDNVMEARNSGVNEILALPITLNVLVQRMAHMYTHPKPFVRADTYTGPCRRRDRAVAYSGRERRHGDKGFVGDPAYVQLIDG